MKVENVHEVKCLNRKLAHLKVFFKNTIRGLIQHMLERAVKVPYFSIVELSHINFKFRRIEFFFFNE